MNLQRRLREHLKHYAAANEAADRIDELEAQLSARCSAVSAPPASCDACKKPFAEGDDVVLMGARGNFHQSCFLARAEPQASAGDEMGYHAAWLEMIEHCSKLKEENFLLRQQASAEPQPARCTRCDGDQYISVHENLPDEPCPLCNSGAPSGAERVRASAAGAAPQTAQHKEAPMTEDQIKHMVNRFLGWKLPETFNPDNGISFDPIASKGTPYEFRRAPQGTNLLDATQADAMVRYMLEGLPQSQAESAERPTAFLAWARETFGSVSLVRGERLMRFAEEAIELAHAAGMERSTLDAITDRVYSREPGTIKKEIGQAQACLEMYAENIGESADALAEIEWQRVQSIPQEEWDRRHAAKQALGIALTRPLRPHEPAMPSHQRSQGE